MDSVAVSSSTIVPVTVDGNVTPSGVPATEESSSTTVSSDSSTVSGRTWKKTCPLVLLGEKTSVPAMEPAKSAMGPVACAVLSVATRQPSSTLCPVSDRDSTNRSSGAPSSPSVTVGEAAVIVYGVTVAVSALSTVSPVPSSSVKPARTFSVAPTSSATTV